MPARYPETDPAALSRQSGRRDAAYPSVFGREPASDDATRGALAHRHTGRSTPFRGTDGRLRSSGPRLTGVVVDRLERLDPVASVPKGGTSSTAPPEPVVQAPSPRAPPAPEQTSTTDDRAGQARHPTQQMAKPVWYPGSGHDLAGRDEAVTSRLWRRKALAVRSVQPRAAGGTSRARRVGGSE